MSERYLWLYRIRGIAMTPPVLFSAICFWHETEADAIIWPVGIALFLGGVCVRIWAQTHLRYRLRVPKKLTTSGPYAHVRNPIYIANTAMLAGMTVMSELLWFVPVMIAWCVVVYGLVARREEAHLLNKYGEPYAAYLTNVPRWFPKMDERRLDRDNGTRFLWPSIASELHCFLLVVPLIAKEALSIFY